MLCHLCEPFLNDLLHQDFANWRHVEPGWYTYKHGDHATIKAAAVGGCETCTLFDRVRREKIRGYDDLNEKWLVQASSIDYKHEYDVQQARADGPGRQSEGRGRWKFYILTVLPEMSWLAFELFHPSLPCEPRANKSAGLGLPHAVSSIAIDSTAVNVATSWLNECPASHTHCSRRVRTPLPTRVLDIQPSDDSFYLRLQVNKGHQGQYVTLSHCWGSQARLTLSKRNLAAFQRQIPFEQLPPTFADAIRLTASLGQRYLWIDALCILQDDQEDWRREAASMCSVFENALFSISALSAEDSHSGLLRERQTAQAMIRIAGTDIGVREHLPSLDEALRQSKLETRAWCLQERLLSPRILHIAPGQLHWECRTFLISETSPDDPLKNDSGEASRPFTATSLKPVASERKDGDHHTHWLSLVAGYSGRNLTNLSDRLPAISGLAEKAKRELALGTYMHGLWLDNLPAGLLWRRKPRRRAASTRKSEDSLLGPTWTWASATGTIDYPLLDAAFQHQPSKADLTLKRRHPKDTREVRGSGADTLSVVGRIKRGSCKEAAKSSTANDAVFRSSGSLLVDEGLACTLDETDETLSRGCYCLFVATYETAPKSMPKGKREERSCYLILERIQIEGASHLASDDIFGTFRRVGTGFDWPRKVDNVFANAERRRLDLA